METTLIITEPKKGEFSFLMSGLVFGISSEKLTLTCPGINSVELIRWTTDRCLGNDSNFVHLNKGPDSDPEILFLTIEYSPEIKDGEVYFTNNGMVSVKIWKKSTQLVAAMPLHEFNRMLEIAAAR